MSIWDIMWIISFAIVLSSLTGLRTFLPITVFSILAKFNLVKVSVIAGSNFYYFVTDDRVLLVFLIATILELLADKIPAVDNFLDNVLLFIKPVFAFIMNYNLIGILDLQGWQVFLLSFCLSLALTGSVSGSKNLVRLTSSVTTLGFGNIFISFLEDLLVIFKMVLVSLFYGFLVFLALALVILSLFLGFKLLNKILGFSKKFLSTAVKNN